MTSIDRSDPHSGAFLDLFLITAAVCCVIASWVHVPRLERIRALEEEKETLQAQIDEQERLGAKYASLQEAMASQPHFRMSVLRRVTGEHPYEVATIDEWVRLRRAAQDQQLTGDVPAADAPRVVPAGVQASGRSSRKPMILGTRRSTGAQRPRRGTSPPSSPSSWRSGRCPRR